MASSRRNSTINRSSGDSGCSEWILLSGIQRRTHLSNGSASSRMLRPLAFLAFVLYVGDGILPVVHSILPPPQDRWFDGSLESLQDYRQRVFGTTNYNYTIQSISLNPELCRTLLEEECQQLDETFQQHLAATKRLVMVEPSAQRHNVGEKLNDSMPSFVPTSSDSNNSNDTTSRSLLGRIKENIFQQLVPNTLTADSSTCAKREPSKIPTSSARLKSQSDTTNSKARFRILVCLLQWSNHDTKSLIPPSDIEILFNSNDLDDVLIPTGSVKRYFDINSYGQVEIEAIVTSEWIPTDNTEQYYSSFGDSGRSPDLVNAFLPVLDTVQEQIDLSQVDQNNDGTLDLTVFLHSGYGGEVSGVDCNTGASSSERIAAHATSAFGKYEWISSSSSYRLGPYVVASAFRNSCGDNIARLGVLVHEILHHFGLPDLYDGDGQYDPESVHIGGLDRYDIMGNPYGQGNRQTRPGHLSAWSKVALGWIEPTEITSDGVYTAQAVELVPDIYKITQGYPDGEYLLIENRQPSIPYDYDEMLWEPGGILIYHIDETSLGSIGNQRLSFANSPRGGPFQTDWPNNGNHYPIALVQADGLFELEQALNGGHAADFWSQPDQALTPGIIEDSTLMTTSLTTRYPNTDSYSFGIIQSTGITISRFVRNENESSPAIYTFQVSGISSSPQVATSTTTSTPPAELPTNRATDPPTMSPTNNPRTAAPTKIPTSNPTKSSFKSPTAHPTIEPTKNPTRIPTSLPTMTPTDEPTRRPPTLAPTTSPTLSLNPTLSMTPTTSFPSGEPTTSRLPSSLPTISARPTRIPSTIPSTSIMPSTVPSMSEEPTISFDPTISLSPSFQPTISVLPTRSASPTRTIIPSNFPTIVPTTNVPTNTGLNSSSRTTSSNVSKLQQRAFQSILMTCVISISFLV